MSGFFRSFLPFTAGIGITLGCLAFPTTRNWIINNSYFVNNSNNNLNNNLNNNNSVVITRKYFSSHLPEVGTYKLSYLEYTNPSLTNNSNNNNNKKDIIICIHGLTRNANDFNNFARKYLTQENINPNTRIVSLDVIGRGESDWLEQSNSKYYKYSTYYTNYFNLLNRILPSLNDNTSLDNSNYNIILFGTSMGGLIGITLCSLYPNNHMINKLIVNDIGPFIPLKFIKFLQTYVGNNSGVNTKQEIVEMINYRYFDVWGKLLSDINPKLWDELIDNSIFIDKNDNNKYKLSYDPNISNNFESVKEDINLWDVYNKLNIDMLLIHGEESHALTFDTCKKMENSGPKPKVVHVPNVGHAPLLFTDLEIDAITQFIKE